MPIIEGGSFFYAKHIFDNIRRADTEDDALYNQSKVLARQIIDKDENDYAKTHIRMEELAKQVELPTEVVNRLIPNDLYRLE